MSLFFTYENNLPAGVGYELFSPTHIAAISVSILMIVFITIWYMISDDPKKLKIRKVTVIIPIVLMILRYVYVFIYGASIVYELPLHLCSMTGIFCFVYEFFLKRSKRVRPVLAQALYALCLPGAMMAILFPDATFYPIIHFISIESYLFHIFIVTYICIRLTDRGIQPSIREAYKSIVFLLAVVPPVYLFNVIFKTNYMFVIGPSTGSPLYGFYKLGGYAGYRIGYAFVAICVIYIMNILFLPISMLFPKGITK